MNLEKIILFLTILSFVACQSETTTSEQATQQVIQVEQTIQQVVEENKTVKPILEEERIRNRRAIISDEKFETIKQYFPENYTLFFASNNEPNIVFGDFNSDKIEDFAITLIGGDKDPDNDIHLLIFEGNGSTFIEKARNENLSRFYADSYYWISLSIKKNVISIHINGNFNGSEDKIRYEAKYDDYMLIGSEELSHGNSALSDETAGTISTNYLSGVRLEKYERFDEKTNRVVRLPEKKSTVSKALKPFSEMY
jgi:hypothetical protein